MKNMLQEIAAFLGGKFALVEKVFATKDSVADVSVRLGAHEENDGIHKTSAQIRSEITEADIPASIARDQEVADRIAEHDGSGAVHADLRNALENLGNGSTVVGRSEYAERLGTPTDSYTKAQLDARINKHVRNVTYHAATATFVFTFEDGTATEIDTPLESTVKDGRFDAVSSELVLVLVSGQEIRIPAAGLVKVYTGQESPTTTTQINAAGEVRADLKQGAVDMVHLSAALQNAVNAHLTKTGDTRSTVTTFAEASVRANIVSGETQATMFGKIRKWFSSLGDLAFKNSVTIAEVDALQTTLNTKADKSSLGALASKDVVAISEVTNLQSTLDAKANTSSLSDYIPLSQKGANSGVATLDGSGKVVTAQLPLGETASTAYRGDRGKIAYDYSQSKRSKTDLDAALQTEINNKLSKGNMILAGNGGQMGYTFIGEGNYDTGMYSDSDGDLYFKINDVKQIPVWEGDARLSNARPANGGNANTVGGISVSNLLKQKLNYVNDLNAVGNAGIYTIIPSIPNGFGDLYGCFAALDGGDGQMYLATEHSENMPPRLKFRNGFNNKRFSNWADIANLSDIPTSLPANGGNADTVDGSHAWRLQSVQNNGNPYGPNIYDVQSRFIGGSGLFRLEIVGQGDTSIYTVSTGHALYADSAGNANKLENHSSADFITNVFTSSIAPTSGMKKGDIWVKP